MKEIDDTPVPKSESEPHPCACCGRETERPIEDLKRCCIEIGYIDRKLEEIELRIAVLETQRVANESNQDDPEWY